jgi:hypothetical protein
MKARPDFPMVIDTMAMSLLTEVEMFCRAEWKAR